MLLARLLPPQPAVTTLQHTQTVTASTSLQTSATTIAAGTVPVSATNFVTGLDTPWSIAFVPDGRIFVTERGGRVRIVQDGHLLRDSLVDVPVAAVGEGGLLGLALDPNFISNRLLYLYYTYRVGSSLFNRVVRYSERDGKARDPTVVIDRIPGANIHDGGRIRFGPDGKLYVTSGDASNPNSAQDINTSSGKVLRINTDGTIPPDNPFPESPIFTYGHRNPQGIDWHPATGTMLESEHGPTGEFGQFAHDEINLLEKGNNYGWPVVIGKGNDPRFVNPLIDTGNDTWAPSGISFYSGRKIHDWTNSLFVACLRGARIQRIVLDGSGREVVRQEPLFQNAFGRLRDVVQGPDEALYVLTSNRDGRGTPALEDDRILRVGPP